VHQTPRTPSIFMFRQRNARSSRLSSIPWGCSGSDKRTRRPPNRYSDRPIATRRHHPFLRVMECEGDR